MGLFDILNKKNNSKSSENLDTEAIKQKNRAQTSQYCDYVKNNFSRIYKLLSDLHNETENLISKIVSLNGTKLSFKEKGDLRRNKEKAYENLEYLYLSRDFFLLLSKNANGIALQDKELQLVLNFIPYFDGTPVLNVDDDDSAINAVKGFISSFGNFSKIRHFDFDDYLYRYDEMLHDYVMPDLYGAIESFKNAISTLELSSNAMQPKVILCPYCGAKLNTIGFSGECEYCGASLN